MSTTYSHFKAALLLGCFFILSSCENSKEEVDAIFSTKAAVEEAKDVDSYLSQDGKIKARLTAPFMLRQVTDSNFIEFPRSLHVDFYDSLANIETILNAKYGKYREYESKVLLRDSVIVINIKNGDTLRTPELWWDQNKQEFYTEKPSHISKRDGTVIFSKNGMKAKQDLSWYELYGNSGQLPVPDEANPNAPVDSLRRDSAAPRGSVPPPPTPTPAPVKQEPVTQPAIQPAVPPSIKPGTGATHVLPGRNLFMRRTDSMRAERDRRNNLLRRETDAPDKPVKQQ